MRETVTSRLVCLMKTRGSLRRDLSLSAPAEVVEGVVEEAADECDEKIEVRQLGNDFDESVPKPRFYPSNKFRV